MKKEFSTKWKESKRPGKQRKYSAKAPLHKKRKMFSVNLSKELRKKHTMRNIVLVKGDEVKIMRGKFKNKKAKVKKIEIKKLRVFLDGITVKKMDGSSSDVPMKASSLQIISLNLDDKKRMKTQNIKNKQEKEKQEKNAKEI